ncbi:MAG: glycoside hydrolase family 97 protein [Brevundimonas sp.]
MKFGFASTALAAVLASAAPAFAADGRECVSSPSEALTVCISVGAAGATYDVVRDGQAVIAASALGLQLDGKSSAPADHIVSAVRAAADQTWEQPWGEQRLIRDHHNELRLSLAGQGDALPYDLVVRAFDDGFGFRYVLKAIGADEAVAVTDELTQFNFVGTYDAWWYPAREKERDEYLYARTPLNAVTLAETPFTMESIRPEGSLYLSVHEAALTGYSSMNLRRTGENAFKADLMPWSDGVLVKRTGPFQTPWRTVLIGETPGALADSRIELNLNEPNKLGDVSWFQPTKYVGVWWEMHLNHSTWGSGPTHGANNDNVRRYIDFAAENGFGGVLVEGWNLGWDGDWVANGDKFDFTHSYPDFDLPALAAYAQSKGTNIIGHHETGGAVENYEAQMEAAYALYESVGVHSIKTGYVRPNGTIVRGKNADGTPQHEWFAGQYRVDHELRAALAAAQHRVALDAHEPVKDTGLRRTYPNMISREGARGQEFNAWGRPTNPPEHVTILPFTRMLAGPMDYTPGIFDLTFGKTNVNERVQSTLATQLALYVVLYSPVQMAADLPSNYAAHPDAFQFIKDVPVDWETSRTLNSVIGDYTVIARQQRGGADWYLGAVGDETAHEALVALDFLDPARRYEAQIYQDGPGADYLTNPYAFRVTRQTVGAGDILTLKLAPGGGQAIRFRALD